MLSRDGEADRYPRRGPDDLGAPFFDGTMEHVVSSTPTDATRRNPGILGPYYPDENGPEGVLRERRAARRASGRLAGRIRAPRAGDRGVGLPLRRRDRAKTTDQERRRSVRNRSLHVDVARRVYRRARVSRGCTGFRSAAPGRADRAPTKGVQPISIAAVLAAVPDTERRRAAVLAA